QGDGRLDDVPPRVRPPAFRQQPQDQGTIALAAVADDRRTRRRHRRSDTFCSGYNGWIEDRSKGVPQSHPDSQATAREHLKNCADAVERMRVGVNLLADNDIAWKAFVLTNQAMLEQRARADWHAGGRTSEQPERSDAQQWRPFQLGFILLCLDG